MAVIVATAVADKPAVSGAPIRVPPPLGVRETLRRSLALCQVFEAVDPGREVVLAAAHRDDARERPEQVRRLPGDGHLRGALRVLRAQDHVLVLPEPERVAAVPP